MRRTKKLRLLTGIRSRESDGSYPTPVPASEAYKI
jgi:hypothetical protein